MMRFLLSPAFYVSHFIYLQFQSRRRLKVKESLRLKIHKVGVPVDGFAFGPESGQACFLICLVRLIVYQVRRTVAIILV